MTVPTLSPDLSDLNLQWTDCEPCEFQFASEAQRNAAAILILTFYGDRACYEDLTSGDGLYHPSDANMVGRAVSGWECAMSAAKFDPHRTADERAKCLANLAEFRDVFGTCWGGYSDSPLGYIMKLEGFPT